MTSVAFIGLGVMGAPMAGHLIRNGHEVAVFDVSEQAMRPFAAMDCCRAASAADAADGADVVMTILPDIAHVRSALLDKGGATETLTPGKLVVEMSTVGAAASLALAGDLKTRGFRMVDAPVGRPPSAARDGTLLVMAGGEARDVEEARPLFDCFADTVVHVGPQGTGIKLKLVNNYMAMVGMAMTAETLALADAVGLDRKLTVDVLRTTAAGRGQINVNFPTKVLAGDITPDFPLRMGLKDISHALDMGAQSHVPLSLGAAARVYFSLAEAWGRAEQDCTAMLLLLEDIARLEPQSSGPTKR